MLFWAEQSLEVYPELVGLEFGLKSLLLLTDFQVRLFFLRNWKLPGLSSNIFQARVGEEANLLFDQIFQKTAQIGPKRGARPKCVYADLAIGQYPYEGLSSWCGQHWLEL